MRWPLAVLLLCISVIRSEFAPALARADGWSVGTGGTVLNSADLGTNWTENHPTEFNLNSVYFNDPLHGWAGGAGGVVLRTMDGGANWTSSTPVTTELRSVHFADASNGWAVGVAGTVLRTVDGGANWLASNPVPYDLNSVRFVDAMNGWAVGGSGIVIHTADGGLNWGGLPLVPQTLNSVFFVDANNGWAVGDAGIVLKTTNGGANWSSSFSSTSNLHSVYFVDASHGWAVGDLGTVLRTIDGGANWLASAPSRNGLNSVFFADASTGWAVGSGGTLIQTSTGGSSWTSSTIGLFGADLKAIQFPRASYTVTTVPSGLGITVDGTPYTAPQTFSWTPATMHTIDVTSPQGAGGTQNVFTGWSDGGAQAHTVTAPSSPATYTASFKVQYQLTTIASPSAGGTVSPASGGFYDSGVVVPVTATANASYGFANWSGDASGSANPTNVSMTAPKSVTANFITGYTVTTNPGGLGITVDGTPYTAPQTFSWTPATMHTIDVTSPQGAGGTQNVFTGWSDGGAQAHTVTAPSSPATYTASFKVQYQLTTIASPSAGGTVSPASGGFYDSGVVVPVTATANASYGFAN